MKPQHATIESLEGRGYLSGATEPVLAVALPGGAENRDFATDRAGNLYVSGIYFASTDFNPLRRKTYTLPGDHGTFVAKYTKDGRLLWARGVVGLDEGPDEGSITINALAVTPGGSVVATGKLLGTVDFDPGTGIQARTAHMGAADTYMWRLGADGEFRGAGVVDCSGVGGFDEGFDVALDREGNAIVTGSWVESFDPHIQHTTVAKFDTRGHLVWNRVLDGLGGQGVAVDRDGRALVTHTRLSGSALVLTRLSSRGKFLWEGTAANALPDDVSSVFDEEGNAYVAGAFHSGFAFDDGHGGGTHAVTLESPNESPIVMKIDREGRFLWSREVVYANDHAYRPSLAMDVDGFLRVAMPFRGDVELYGKQGTVRASSAGGLNDAFVARIDHTGRRIDAYVTGDPDRQEDWVVVAASASGQVFTHTFVFEKSPRTAPSGIRVFLEDRDGE